MRGLQEIRDAVERVVVDEDRPEQRLLGLDIVRRLAIKRFRHTELSRRLCHPCLDPAAAPMAGERHRSLNHRQQDSRNLATRV
jgi:hypothetical protein